MLICRGPSDAVEAIPGTTMITRLVLLSCGLLKNNASSLTASIAPSVALPLLRSPQTGLTLTSESEEDDNTGGGGADLDEDQDVTGTSLDDREDV